MDTWSRLPDATRRRTISRPDKPSFDQCVAVIDTAQFSIGVPIGSHLPPVSDYYVDLSGKYPYDPAKAKQLGVVYGPVLQSAGVFPQEAWGIDWSAGLSFGYFRRASLTLDVGMTGPDFVAGLGVRFPL